MPLCGVPSMIIFFAYLASGIGVGVRMLRHGRHGRPSGLAAYRMDSYTPKGQRILRLFLRGWVFGFPLALVLAGLLGGALCRLAGWSPKSP